jgi:hypothetical protein
MLAACPRQRSRPRADVLHGVVDRQPSGHRAARRVDVEWMSRLGSSDSRNSSWAVTGWRLVVTGSRGRRSVLEQTGEDVERPLTTTSLLDDDGMRFMPWCLSRANTSRFPAPQQRPMVRRRR